MSRYIDADKFLENESEAYMRAQINLAKEHTDKTIEATRYVNGEVHKKIQMLINAMDSVDVAEVVRCKDCKFNKAKDKDEGICSLMGYIHNADDYCSYGERKD